MQGREWLAEALSVEGVSAGESINESCNPRKEPASPAETVRMFSGGRWHEAPLYRREELAAGQRLDGPAIIAEANTTTVVEPERIAAVSSSDCLTLEEANATSSN